MNHSRQGFIVHKLLKPESAAQGQGLFLVCLHTAVYILHLVQKISIHQFHPLVQSTSSASSFFQGSSEKQELQ